MTDAQIHTVVILLTAASAGRATSKGQYGWAVTFGLLFFAILKY